MRSWIQQQADEMSICRHVKTASAQMDY